MRHAEEALRGHLSLMIEDGDEIPNPTEIDQIEVDSDIDHATTSYIRAELPDKAVRVNVTVDEGLLEAIDTSATGLGLSRSGFIAEAARHYLAALPFERRRA